MTIREYTHTDYPQLLELISELKDFESEFDLDYLTGKEADEVLINEITKPLNDGYGRIYVAEEDKKLLGFISFNLDIKNIEGIFRKVEVIYISDIMVRKDCRGKGIGKQLINIAKEYAKERKIKSLKLIVFSNNIPAKKFYESVGFEEYEVTMLHEIK